jgi:hypothetical protein
MSSDLLPMLLFVLPVVYVLLWQSGLLTGLLAAFLRKRLQRSRGGALLGIASVFVPAACALAGVGLVAEVSPPLSPAGTVLPIGVGYSVFLLVLPYVTGLHLRGDVIERDNPAAAIAITAAALAFLPAIVGTHSFAAWPANEQHIPWAASPLTLAAAWLALELRSKISWAITIDRDAGAALRLAAFMLATAMSPAFVLLSALVPAAVPARPGWWQLVAPLPVLLLALNLEWNARTPTYPLAPRRSLPVCGAYLLLGAASAAATFMIPR